MRIVFAFNTLVRIGGYFCGVFVAGLYLLQWALVPSGPLPTCSPDPHSGRQSCICPLPQPGKAFKQLSYCFYYIIYKKI